MTAGAGCWGPGIHWDAENSAAFVGPRAGSWPYSASCPITAKNGLLLDANTGGQIYTPPPMGMYPYVTHGASTDSGSNLTPSPYVLQGSSYTAKIGSNPPAAITLPAYTCGPAGILEYDSMTLDVTVGTNSSVSLSGLSIPQTAWEWTNSQNPVPTQGTDTINGYKISVSNAYQLYWSDEPWGAGSGSSAVPGTPTAGQMLGSFNIPGKIGGWIATDAVMPIDTTHNNGFTCSFWVKPIAWNDSSPVFSLYNAPNSSLIEIQLRTDSPNNLRLFFQTPSVNPSSSWTTNTSVSHLGANTWNFVALVFSPPSSLYLYCNSSTGQFVQIPFAPLWHATGMALNANYSYGNSPAASYANLRTWQRALTSTEIGTLLSSPTITGPSGGTAWWPLNDGVNRQRIIRTITGSWAPSWATGQSRLTVANAAFFGSGANASLINAWTAGLTGVAYSPQLSTYAGS